MASKHKALVNNKTLLKSKAVQIWARRLHIYISMALLLVVLFFAITGVTLNRPALFVKSQPDISQLTLSLPVELLSSDGGKYVPNESALVKHLTQYARLSGQPSALQVFTEVEDGELLEGEITMDYKGPGYNVAVFIDMTSAVAVIEKTHYGAVAVLNDLHKGRNSGEVWKWFIDITALLMVFFVLTGVCLLVPKKKTFNTSLKWTVFGSLTTLLIFFVAVP
ncbi:PepSY-associated TM helix domain-containing protein [Photobacterium sp.]|uniref:PepSY-associated TM helix domain-containing protein n=1 Tax=Photobacterium sp. TaxID=660 RepID=UPI00299F3729|nr:PepSY-associated TM helix domain-containing protein [Photobacterium sp.]MDX1303516.1 PepSY-associated TM helix domain-containing protein [Photobacterium sp.]